MGRSESPRNKPLNSCPSSKFPYISTGSEYKSVSKKNPNAIYNTSRQSPIRYSSVSKKNPNAIYNYDEAELAYEKSVSKKNPNAIYN